MIDLSPEPHAWTHPHAHIDGPPEVGQRDDDLLCKSNELFVEVSSADAFSENLMNYSDLRPVSAAVVVMTLLNCGPTPSAPAAKDEQKFSICTR